MEKENNEIISEDEYLKLKRSNEKKKALIVILVFSIVLMSIILALFFLCNGKQEPKSSEKKDGTIVETNNYKLSNDEAISIVKTKLETANGLFGDFKSDINCTDEITGDKFLCYYDSFENFKNKFYSVYAKTVSLDDVYINYNVTDNTFKEYDISKNGFDSIEEAAAFVVTYTIKDNKIYIDNMCRANGADKSNITDYNVVSIENNKIIVNYKLEMFTNEIGKEETIVLVKENNEWKIEHAAIFNKCGMSVKVGK